MSCLTEGKTTVKELSLELQNLNCCIWSSGKSKEKEIQNLEEHIQGFKVNNSSSILSQNEETQASIIWEKIKMIVFDHENFIIGTAMYALHKAAFCSEAYSFYFHEDLSEHLDYKIEIVEKNGEFLEVQKLQKLDRSHRRSFSITEFVNYNIYMSFVPELGVFFGDALKATENISLNLFQWTRDKAIWSYFKSLDQTSILSVKNSSEAFRQKEFNTSGGHIKPNKNVYPCLFNWVISMILNIQVENQQDKVETLITNRDQILEELISNFEEDVGQLRSLKREDFVEVIRSWNNRCLFLSNLREKLKQVGIDKDMIERYHKDYQSDPSFRKIYKLRDEKQIYFWIIAIAVILKELPLESTQLENDLFMYWILQNPNMGLKLKINICNLEMRNYYYKTMKEVQNTLLNERNITMKEMLLQTLEIIGENPHKPELAASKTTEKAKRPATHALGEEELRPIHKVQITNNQTLKSVIVSQPTDWAIKKFIEKTTSTYDGYLREFIIEQFQKAMQYSRNIIKSNIQTN